MISRIFKKIKNLSILSEHISDLGIDAISYGSYTDSSELRIALTAYRKSLKKRAGLGAIKGLSLAEGRYAKNKSRNILKSYRRGKKPKFSKSVLVRGVFSNDKLAEGLMPNRRDIWVPLARRREINNYKSIILKNFCFISHPKETMLQLKKILEFESVSPASFLHFDDEYCTDVSVYLVLAEMWPKLAPIFRGGRMSVPIQKVVEVLRLRNDLMMKLSHLSDIRDVWAFPRHERRVAGSSRSDSRHDEPQSREHVADKFCDALNVWLKVAADEVELSTSGKARFGNIIGELLDNAERHSNPPGSDGGWSIAAFMAKRMEDGEEVFRCHMGFLSVGASMAESLSTASNGTKSTITDYIRLHKNCGISEDTLTTLVALQDGITRDQQASDSNRGGVGLQEVLELINDLGRTHHSGHRPRMTIVSGRSCIQAREPYLFGTRRNENAPRVLWFNEENSHMLPPERGYVFDLPSHFPGTIIGITFVLSKTDLMAGLDETH